MAVLGLDNRFIVIWNNPRTYLDAIIILGLSVGVLRNSRVSAICLFGYVILLNIIFIIVTGNPLGGLVSLFVLYFFGRAIQGTFAYHRIHREQDPEYRPVGRATYLVSGLVILIVAMLAGFMLLGTR